MSDAEATVRFVILDGLASSGTPEGQVEAILEGLFHNPGTVWAAPRYIAEVSAGLEAAAEAERIRARHLLGEYGSHGCST